MDEKQARAALDEVDRRRGEATRIAAREGAPAWFVVACGVVLLALALVSDLRAQLPGWDGWFARWGVPALGIAVIGVCALVVHRRATVTAHRSASGRQMAEAAVGLVAFYVVAMAIGIPMRDFRIPFDQTVSAAGALIVVLAGWGLWRYLVARRG